MKNKLNHYSSDSTLILLFFFPVIVFFCLKMAKNNTCNYDKPMGFFYNNSNITSDEWEQTQLILVQCAGSICCCFILVANAMIIAAVVTNIRSPCGLAGLANPC